MTAINSSNRGEYYFGGSESSSSTTPLAGVSGTPSTTNARRWSFPTTTAALKAHIDPALEALQEYTSYILLANSADFDVERDLESNVGMTSESHVWSLSSYAPLSILSANTSGILRVILDMTATVMSFKFRRAYALANGTCVHYLAAASWLVLR